MRATRVERKPERERKRERIGMASKTTDQLRELAHRASEVLDVSSYRNERTDSVTVQVYDARAGEGFELEVDGRRALDIYRHPFAYAAVEKRAAGGPRLKEVPLSRPGFTVEGWTALTTRNSRGRRLRRTARRPLAIVAQPYRRAVLEHVQAQCRRLIAVEGRRDADIPLGLR
jgi:hypothetical protein